jgi:hypothetical protein
MGRTVPSYRIATEWEKRKWKSFRQELDKSERKIFDEMMIYHDYTMLLESGLANLS